MLLQSWPLWAQFALLAGLIVCSAFFSGSETSMMSLNRHRLKHQAQDGHSAAKRANHLLSRPDRLLGVILLGNNFVNILAASLATLIGIRLWGEAGVLLASIFLTVVLLVFGEVAPKTYAAMNAEKCAFSATWPLTALLKLLYPLVYVLNLLAALLLKPLGLKNFSHNEEAVSREELKSILRTTGDDVHEDNQEMLLGLLHLEDIFVEDLMVAKHEIIGIDLADDWTANLAEILSSQYSRLVIYREGLDVIEGVLQLKDLLPLYRDQQTLTEAALLSVVQKPYFIPEATNLRKQLGLFQKNKQQTGFIVDEYGHVVGLLTLEDIIEYIVGDLGLQEMAEEEDGEEIVIESDGRYLIDGTLSIRYLNRELDWRLPTDGPTTIGGLVLEQLGKFPQIGTTVVIEGYEITVKQFADNRINQVQIRLLT